MVGRWTFSFGGNGRVFFQRGSPLVSVRVNPGVHSIVVSGSLNRWVVDI